MPVVPAPPEEEMPRIEMALVPELSMLTPGVKRTMSWKSLMPLLSISSCVSAVTLIGTLLRDSSRRVAVTTTSCSPPCVVSVAVVLSAGAVCASAWVVARPARHSVPVSSHDFRFMQAAFVMMFSPLDFDPHSLGLQQHRCVGAPAYKHFITPV